MSLSLLAIGALALSTPAQAEDDRPTRELHLVTGSYGTGDRHFDFYSPNAAIGASGARLTLGLKGPWSVVAGYTRRTVVSEYFDSLVESSNEALDRDDAALIAGFTGQQVTFGPKVQLDHTPSFGTYLTAQGLAFMGTSRLDDDPTSDENRNQLKSFGWAPGFVTAVGVAYHPKVDRIPFQPSTFLEMGYNWTAQLELTDENVTQHGTNEPASLGELSFRGFYVQAGLGFQF